MLNDELFSLDDISGETRRGRIVRCIDCQIPVPPAYADTARPRCEGCYALLMDWARKVQPRVKIAK